MNPTYIAPPPTRWWRPHNDARARVQLAAFFFLQGLCVSSWVAQIPAFAAKLQLSHEALGMALLAMSSAAFLTLPVAGYWAAFMQTSRALRLGACAHALTLASLGFAQSFASLVVLLFFFGCANTWVQITINSQAVLLEQQLKRSLLASMHGCWSIAAVTGAMLAALCGHFAVASQHHLWGVAAAVVLLAWATRGRAAPLLQGAATAQPVRSLRGIPGPLWTLGGLAFAAMFVESVIFDWGGVYLREVAGEQGSQANFAYAALMAGMTCGRGFADRIANVLPPYLFLRLLSATVVVGLSVALLQSHPVVVVAGFVLVGLGLSATVPLLLSACSRSVSLPPSQAISVVSMIGRIGALLGPTAMGFAAGPLGLRLSLFGVGAIAASVGLLGRYAVYLRPQVQPLKSTQTS